MTVSVTGLTFKKVSDCGVAGAQYARFDGYGTYTAVDFTITAADGLGFTPNKVEVLNLTDRTSTVAYRDTGLTTTGTLGLVTVANGTRTYAAHGVTFGANSVGITIATAGPITNNDDFVIECWA